MKGFISTRLSLEPRFDRFTGMTVLSQVSPEKEHRRMKEAGFSIDEENYVYTREGYGAFKTNVDSSIKTIDDLRSYYDDILECNPYEEIISLMDEEGYEFVLGPGAPDMNGNDTGLPGLYCKNYKEIIERQKTEKREDREVEEKQ